MMSLNPRKLFLYLLIASVSTSALIGIAAIVLGNFGDTETKILLTTLTVTYTSLLGLACGACLETGRARVLPIVGIVAAIVGGILWVLVIWGPRSDSDLIGKLVINVNIVAAATALLSLVTIARLDRRFIWTRWLLHIAVWSMVSIATVLTWTNFNNVADITTRVLAVLGIVAASLTVVTPVLHKLSGNEDGSDDPDKLDAEIASLKEKLAELEARRARLDAEAETPEIPPSTEDDET